MESPKNKTKNQDASTHPLIPAILANIEVAVVAVDIYGVVFYANQRYGDHIGKSLDDILGRKMTDVYEGSTTITALKTKRKVVVERKVCPVDKTQFVTGIASPLYDGADFVGAYSLYMNLPPDGIELDHSTQSFFTKYVKDRLYDSMKQLEDYNIIGQSARFLDIIERASIIAETDVPVMIRGENGVGKEVIAKYIHNKSRRSEGPFVVVNCAAIPENLFESELFGYESGSFTGAKKEGKAGKFELANGGTLFLDEIGDLPLMMQPKLLRALQDNEIDKIGTEKTVGVDVRIITATNQPLEQMIATKEFREDFYYRINSFSLRIPPLRERIEDVTLLTDYYLTLYNEKYGKNVKLSPEAVFHMNHYHWPGNIRELKNCLENAVIMCEEEECDSNTILGYLNQTLDNREDEVSNLSNRGKLLSQVVADAEKKAIINALEVTDNNKTEAMKILGLSRKTFYRKLNDYNLLEKKIENTEKEDT